MKKYLVFVVAAALGVCIFGCGKKKESLSEMQEPMSIDALSTVNTTAASAPAAVDNVKLGVDAQKVAAEAKPAVAPETAAPTGKLEPLPPQGNYKPTVTEIQTALKNAGFYTGLVDGKSGPMTKKAIEAFQKSKGIKADGKVGPKTWGLLSVYLNQAADVKVGATKKR